MTLSEEKRKRLAALATSSGVIAAVAVDQRSSLRRMLAHCAGLAEASVTDAQLADFKRAVTRVLSPHASAILIDPEFGSAAFPHRASGCGLLATYEMDGFENPRPHRMLALLPQLSARRLRDMGADGVKILLSYTPFDDAAANDAKRALIERIGHECEAAGLPFFLEPVSYDPGGLDPKSLEYARIKPRMVTEIMREFSRDVYKVDVLKVEFPVNVSYVAGSPVCSGQAAYSTDEALGYFREADAAARRPYIYLSAGVSAEHFRASLGLAANSGARFSGVLCGRATWQDGAPVFMRDGLAAFEQWLAAEGAGNIEAINALLECATPWHAWLHS